MGLLMQKDEGVSRIEMGAQLERIYLESYDADLHMHGAMASFQD